MMCRVHIVAQFALMGLAAELVTVLVLAPHVRTTLVFDALGLLLLALSAPHFLWFLSLIHVARQSLAACH